MSELKAYTADDIQELDDERLEASESGMIDCTRVYLKFDADKVIAELKDNLGTVNQIVKASRELLLESQRMHKRCADNAAKIIRHQKYKRCLAMAKWCESEAYIHEHGSDYDEDLAAWFGKWYKRWLEIAEKFKDSEH